MMKRNKDLCRRWLALFLSFVLCVGMLSTTAFATGEGTPQETEITQAAPEAPEELAAPTPKPEAQPEPTPEPDPKPEVTPDPPTPTEPPAEPGQDEETTEPETTPDVTPEPDSNPEVTPEPDSKPEGAPDSKPESEDTPESKPEQKDDVPAPSYASVDEFMAACGAMGDADDMNATLAVLKNIASVYNRLSPMDKASVAVAWAYVQSYRAQIETGNPDKDIETLDYTTYNTTITFYPGDGNPTGVRMSVGALYWNNWYVSSISTSSVTFGTNAGGQHNNGFKIPAPEAIWTGVSSNYKTVAAYSNAFNGEQHIGAVPILIYTGGHATYKNVINVPSTPDPNPGGDPSIPSGPYVTVIHNYYTNNSFDGSKTTYQAVTAPTYNVPKTIFTSDIDRVTIYGGKNYNFSSISSNPSSVTVAKGATGNQGTFTLRYDRQEQVAANYTYQLTWDYNGGKVGNDFSRIKTETTNESTYTFYEDAQGYGSPRPTRDGYTFVGWTYSGNGNFIESNGQVNMDGIANGTVAGTLKAQWKQTVTPNPAIKVTKTVDGSSSVRPGQTVKFIITVENTGNVDFTMVAVSDRLPDGLTFVSATGNPMTTTPSIVWVLNNVSAGKVVTFVVTATVDEDATGTLTNTVQATGKTSSNAQTNDSDSASVTVDAGKATAKYTVEWYNTEGETIKRTDTRSGTVGETVAVTDADKIVEGYTFDADNEGNNLSATLAENGTVLRLYFTKDETPGPVDPTPDTITVTWKDGYTETPIKIETIDKDGNYENLYPDDPTRDGYAFTGWSNPVTDADGNITITAQWKPTGGEGTDPTPEVKYTIYWYLLDSTLDTVLNTIKTEIRTDGTVGELVAVTEADKVLDGYTFVNHKDTVLSATLETVGTVLKLYFTENKTEPGPIDPIDPPEQETVNYTVEWYDTNGNTIKPTATRTDKAGSTVSVTDNDKVISGYTFVPGDNRNVLSDTLADDGNTVLKLYFSRNSGGGSSRPDPDPKPPADPEPPVDPDPPVDPEPPVDVPDPDVPLVPPPEEPPVVDVPEEDPPLVDIPEAQPPLVEVPDTDVPQVNVPQKPKPPKPQQPQKTQQPQTDIPDEAVPLAEVPQTGDNSGLWASLLLLSGAGLTYLLLDEKKRRDNSK